MKELPHIKFTKYAFKKKKRIADVHFIRIIWYIETLIQIMRVALIMNASANATKKKSCAPPGNSNCKRPPRKRISRARQMDLKPRISAWESSVLTTAVQDYYTNL